MGDAKPSIPVKLLIHNKKNEKVMHLEVKGRKC